MARMKVRRCPDCNTLLQLNGGCRRCHTCPDCHGLGSCAHPRKPERTPCTRCEGTGALPQEVRDDEPE